MFPDGPSGSAPLGCGQTRGSAGRSGGKKEAGSGDVSQKNGGRIVRTERGSDQWSDPDHEPRIRRREIGSPRKAQYFRVEPPLAAASLSETDTPKLESMDANANG